MSLETSSSLHPALSLGDTLPSENPQENGSHLYVSMSEMIMEYIFYHPEFNQVLDSLDSVQTTSIQAILGDSSVEEHFVSTLVEQIKAASNDSHTTIRIGLSNADSYAFSSLLGGSADVTEVNPALGLRGVSRYASAQFSLTFALECKVIKALQEQGLTVEIVVPFVRALSDAAKIIDLLAEQGLPRGLNGLKVLYTVDVPSSALLAERLLHYFDGVVINLENLAQFTLGVDRLNESLEYLFDPQSEAVIDLIDMAVKSAQASNKPVIMVSSGLANYKKIQEYIVENGQLDAVVTM